MGVWGMAPPPPPQLPRVTLIPGDGIGPEISKAVKDIFHAANVCLTPRASFFLQGRRRN